MDDLISRQAAIDAIENAFDRETILNRFVRKIAISAVRKLPPAQPEIIRCKECKHCKHWDGVDTCDVIDAPVWDNDFCSMAERRSNE